MPPHPTRRRRALLLVLRIAVVVGLIVLLSRVIHPGDLARARVLVGQLRWSIALVLLPTLIAMSIDALGWKIILRTLGHGVRWRRMLELRLSVEAIVLAMPGGSVAGEAAKVALLERRAEVPLAAGAASLALTKLQLIASDALYLSLAGIAVGFSDGQWRLNLPAKLAFAGAALTAAVTVVLASLLHRSRSGSWLARVIARLPSAAIRAWMERRRARFEELDVATRLHFDSSRAARLACFLPFLAEWLVEGAETWLILRCVGTSLTLGQTLALDGVGSLLRAVVIFVPAGLGIQDATQLMLMRELNLTDPIATGAAFIFIKRTKEIFWIVIGSLFLAVRRDLWRRKVPRSPATSERAP